MAGENLNYIDLVDSSGKTKSVGYGYSSRDPDCLYIVGGLNNGSTVRPASVNDAQKMVDWMSNWIKENQK